MNEPALEKGIRRVAWVIIAAFLLLMFVPYVGMMLYDAFTRNPQAVIGFLLVPGCWAILVGPVFYMLSLAAVHFRLPQEIRRESLGQLGGRSGYYRSGGMTHLFTEYFRQRGYDWVMWVVTVSGLVTFFVAAAIVSGVISR